MIVTSFLFGVLALDQSNISPHRSLAIKASAVTIEMPFTVLSAVEDSATGCSKFFKYIKRSSKIEIKQKNLYTEEIRWKPYVSNVEAL